MYASAMVSGQRITRAGVNVVVIVQVMLAWARRTTSRTRHRSD